MLPFHNSRRNPGTIVDGIANDNDWESAGLRINRWTLSKIVGASSRLHQVHESNRVDGIVLGPRDDEQSLSELGRQSCKADKLCWYAVHGYLNLKAQGFMVVGSSVRMFAEWKERSPTPKCQLKWTTGT